MRPELRQLHMGYRVGYRGRRATRRLVPRAPATLTFDFEAYLGGFYRPRPLRPPEEIRADILALEQETEGVVGGHCGRRRTGGC